MAACSFWSDEELGNGYYYLPDYEAVDIGYCEGSTIYKSIKKNYYQTILIQGGILEVSKNRDFILVGQNKQQIDLKHKTDVYYYWIIIKDNSEVFGPLTFDEYMIKKKEMGVPECLKLKCEKNNLDNYNHGIGEVQDLLRANENPEAELKLD